MCDAMMHLLKRLGFSKADNAHLKAEDEQGKLLRKFGRKGRRRGQLDMPAGISITKSGDIVVADTENHRVQIFSPEGKIKVKFGEQGLAPEQLCYPMGVVTFNSTFSRDEHVEHELTERVAVTDSANSAVKIFSLSGKLESVYEHPDNIRMPYGISVTADGCHFVTTDIFKHCVTVLDTHSGAVSHSFGSYGDGAQQLDHPYHVTTNSTNQIIVSDVGNAAIKIFHFMGRLLSCFCSADFKLPPEVSCYLGCVATDSDDNTLVVCSGGVYILTKDGHLWEVLTEERASGLTTCPRGLAYATGLICMTQCTPDSSEVCVFRYNKDDYQSLNALGHCDISI